MGFLERLRLQSEVLRTAPGQCWRGGAATASPLRGCRGAPPRALPCSVARGNEAAAAGQRRCSLPAAGGARSPVPSAQAQCCRRGLDPRPGEAGVRGRAALGWAARPRGPAQGRAGAPRDPAPGREEGPPGRAGARCEEAAPAPPPWRSARRAPRTRRC